MVWAAVTFLTGLAGRECVVRVGRVCGTVRKAEVEAVRWGKRGVGRVRREIEGGAGLVGGLGVSVEEEQGDWGVGDDGVDEQGILDVDTGEDDEDDDDDDDD
jgi:Rpp14/Pop5 family